MSLQDDNATQTFLELLYARSGRTNGLYTGLYQEWSKGALKAQRDQELQIEQCARTLILSTRNKLDKLARQSRNPRRTWVSRVFGQG